MDLRLPGDISQLPRARSQSHISGHPKIILDDVERHLVDRLNMPQNFILYAFSLPHRLPQQGLHELRDLLARWVHRDAMASIAGYPSVIQALFEILKDNLTSDVFLPSHAIAQEMSKELSRDVSLIHDQLASILRDPGMYKSFLACRGDLAQQLLDLLQDLLDSIPDSSDRPLLSQALLRLAQASGLHPTCFPISGLQQIGQQVAAGAFSDIFEGSVHGQLVSVKRMRIFEDTDVKIALKAFGREAHIWRQLSHPNLLPFFGLYYHHERLCLVSPWMSNGHILQFLANSPPDIDRLTLILDVALGLEYLHNRTVVHGDLKGMNILVTPSYTACIADFGLSSIADAMTLRFTHSTGSSHGGTVRYQAPELILMTKGNHTGSDVYAFACVVYEILTGNAPFSDVLRDVAVGIQVLQGFRPSRPATMSYDALWMLLEDCWDADYARRPNATQIIQRLLSPLIGARRMRSAVDWDETSSARFRRSLKAWPLLPSVAWIQDQLFGDLDVSDEQDSPIRTPPQLSPKRFRESRTDRDSDFYTIERFPRSTTRRSPRVAISSSQSRWHPSPVLFPVVDDGFRGLDPAKWTRFSVGHSCLIAEHDDHYHHDALMPENRRYEVFLYTSDLCKTSPPATYRSRQIGAYDVTSLLYPIGVNLLPQNQVFDIDLMYRNYSTQKPADAGPAATDNVSLLGDFGSTELAICDGTLSPPELQDFSDNFDALFGASPLFSDVSSFTSPAEPTYDEFSTAPEDDSPFIATPLFPSASDSVYVVHDGDLFGGVPSPSPSPPPRYRSPVRRVSSSAHLSKGLFDLALLEPSPPIISALAPKSESGSGHTSLHPEAAKRPRDTADFMVAMDENAKRRRN